MLSKFTRLVLTASLCAGACLFIVACGSGSAGSDTPFSTGVIDPDGDNFNDGMIEAPPAGQSGAKTRYAFNNQCFAIQSSQTGQFITRSGDNYAADGTDITTAEPFLMRPSALGKYLIVNSDGDVLTAGRNLSNRSSARANDGSEWTLTGTGDTTVYPNTPTVDEEPTPQFVSTYRNFVDPQLQFENFTVFSASSDNNLATTNSGALAMQPRDGDLTAASFRFEPATGCANFPEAQSNVAGATFNGTQPDGSVLGMADVHVHISASTFLGGAQFGMPFHAFGVEHAIGDCAIEHGPNGVLDAVGSLFSGDFDGHNTSGWPTFPDWPARGALTHEAIYWKWLERAWQSGLRIAVNDVVDNETLCELQRNIVGGDEFPTEDCNAMNNASAQVGTMFAMQDYIDAQYGGRGKGWFRIVLDPTEARRVIEQGKLAVVLGIEISNLFDCKVNYSPLRTQQPFEETGTGLLENKYGCAMTETGADNEILTQLNDLINIGVRQIITIHEFDNAFGGNGIFDDLILNVGNRENSGGIPSGDLAPLTNLIDSGVIDFIRDPASLDPTAIVNLLPGAGNVLTTTLERLVTAQVELPTGEFWTTYDCPLEDETEGFSGYLFGDSGGTVLQGLNPPLCPFIGQNGRAGGTAPCYPTTNQCNARWLTPIGLYTYSKLMEKGLIFDIDHLELEMKSQALELAEAQPIAYPFVSTHGTFGGTSNDQARRILRNGGLIYPSLGNGVQHINAMEELRGVYNQAMTGVPANQRPLFGFGFGTDTNGLSDQSAPRSEIAPERAVTYPYRLFEGSVFNELAEFNAVEGVTFEQPRTIAPDGSGRTWSLDMDGSAQYGMLSGFVQEMRLEGNAQEMRDLFNSAEAYLRTWERTLAASRAINSAGGVVLPEGVLRAAPVP